MGGLHRCNPSLCNSLLSLQPVTDQKQQSMKVPIILSYFVFFGRVQVIPKLLEKSKDNLDWDPVSHGVASRRSE